MSEQVSAHGHTDKIEHKLRLTHAGISRSVSELELISTTSVTGEFLDRPFVGSLESGIVAFLFNQHSNKALQNSVVNSADDAKSFPPCQLLLPFFTLLVWYTWVCGCRKSICLCTTRGPCLFL